MKRVINVLLIGLFVLVLSVNLASAMTVVINIPEKYSEVHAGEKVYFETEVKWPENTGRKDLRIEYTIKDKDNQIIAYIKVLKAIETQASFMDSISIPESVKVGTYAVYLNVNDYKQLEQEVSASFSIVEKPAEQYRFYFFILLGVVGFIAIVVVIELFILIKRKG